MRENIDFAFAIRYYNKNNFTKANYFLRQFGKTVYKLKNTTADGFLLEVLKLKHKFIICVDEDCFIYNSNLLLKLIKYIQDEKYVVAGMRDGGYLPPRNFHPLVMNPFFLVIDIHECNKLIPNPLEEIRAESMIDITKKTISKSSNLRLDYMDLYSNSESYNTFFFKLILNKANLFYLDCSIWKEDPGIIWENENIKIATVLNFKNDSFGIHCWFSSGYIDFENRGTRYKNIFLHAKKLNKKNIFSYINSLFSKQVMIDK